MKKLFSALVKGKRPHSFPRMYCHSAPFELIAQKIKHRRSLIAGRVQIAVPLLKKSGRLFPVKRGCFFCAQTIIPSAVSPTRLPAESPPVRSGRRL